ncbi:enoyl-CoA hydratase/isomerase family protein [Caldimonas sp. KR1-144]|uniref:enoyl-CoA hydratase/isomerase family protein n=1 Tax=Caldimonas sp. KR1-144 TaxID=3400911 RepID=UPI003C0C8748
MSPLIVEREGRVLRLRFNRPQSLNALDVETARAFLAAAREIEADRSLGVVVMSGAGRAFVAGGDLQQLRAAPVETADALIGPLHEALQRLASADAIVLAALHGAVAGAGLSLALAADLAIAAQGTRFNLAYVNVGTSCDLGSSWALPRVVGLRKSMEIALLGEDLDADEALRLGLVNRVVAADALEAETHALAQRVANGPPIALAQIKRLMRRSLERTLAEQLDAEQQAFRHCAATEDFSEALAAFFDKRAPQYRGR